MIHGEGEFGFESCKVKACIDLCVQAWLSPPLRVYFAQTNSPVPRSLTGESALFIDYLRFLTDDKGSRVAAIIDVTYFLSFVASLSTLS